MPGMIHRPRQSTVSAAGGVVARREQRGDAAVAARRPSRGMRAEVGHHQQAVAQEKIELHGRRLPRRNVLCMIHVT